MPELPPFLRGRNIVVIDGAVVENEERAAEILAPLRALGPEMDTFADDPARRPLAHPHGPRGPDAGHERLDDARRR